MSQETDSELWKLIIEIKERLSAVETEQKWLRQSISQVIKEVNRYKYWIVFAFFSSSFLIFIISKIVG